MSDSPTTTDASSGGEVESELSPTASGSDSLPRITPPLSSPKHTHARTHARTHNETGVRGLKKSVKELELSLLQLQQDVHIPRVVLSPHPAVREVVERAAAENRKPTIHDFEHRCACAAVVILSRRSCTAVSLSRPRSLGFVLCGFESFAHCSFVFALLFCLAGSKTRPFWTRCPKRLRGGRGRYSR